MNNRSINNRNVNNRKVFKTFKDYLFPIFLVFVILVLLLNYFFSSSDTIKNTKNDDMALLNIELSSSQTEALIEYSGGNETKIEGTGSLYKSEKIKVVNESVKLKNEMVSFNLNKLGEFRYNEDETYTLYSSDLWCETKKDINIEMRYAKVKGNNGSIFSLSQNEIASTIYVVYGTIEVQNLAGKSTMLQKGDKIAIMRNSSNDANSDLSLSKEPIDDYTKNEDWFLKNNGSAFLSQTENYSSGSLSSTGNLSSNGDSSTGVVLDGNSNYISFSNIYDEFESEVDTLNLEGNILNDIVNNININGKTAEINTKNKTFSLKGFKITSRENDVVYKVYDNQSNLLHKGVITIYYSKGSDKEKTNSSLAQVENYPLTTSPLYKIVSPKSNPYTTTNESVKIEGDVPARTVTRIVVNDFQLKLFPKFGSHWVYNANVVHGNLKPGVNIYNIQFFGEDDKVIYETNFTIIKEEEKKEEKVPEEVKEEKKEEVKIDKPIEENSNSGTETQENNSSGTTE